MRRRNPFLDLVMLSEGGRVEGSWSTLLDYAEMKAPPTIDELLERTRQDGRLHYMAAPTKASVLFYFQGIDQALLELQEFEPHAYAEVTLGGDSRLVVNMAHLPSIKPGKVNPLGPAALKNKNLALGKLGYWARGVKEKTKKGIGFLAADQSEKLVVQQYIMRVYIEEHPSQGFVYITPLQMADLLHEGMLPMDRARKDRAPITRIEASPATKDAIMNFLFAYAQDARVREFPLVLRFNSYRPWEGNYPRHS